MTTILPVSVKVMGDAMHPNFDASSSVIYDDRGKYGILLVFDERDARDEYLRTRL